MRTKLVLGAALLAAGLASSVAQNVYSLNVVGYVNQTVQANKWYMWGNPLKAGNNTAATVLTNLSGTHADWAGAIVYEYSNAGGYANADNFIYVPEASLDGWYAGGTGSGAGGFTDMTPGKGFMFFSPTNGTITFVGEVNTTNQFTLASANGGWNLIASAFPVATNLMTLGLKGQNNDAVYQYDPTAGYYNTANYIYLPEASLNGWYDGAGSPTNGPTLKVGEGVFYQRDLANGPASWTQNFTIQ